MLYLGVGLVSTHGLEWLLVEPVKSVLYTILFSGAVAYTLSG